MQGHRIKLKRKKKKRKEKKRGEGKGGRGGEGRRRKGSGVEGKGHEPPLFGGSLRLWCPPPYLQILATPLVITNFVIPKRDKKTNKKTSHFFVYSRRTTQDHHHTSHGDRGDPSYFCTPPQTFLMRSVVSPLGAIENLWENAPTAAKCL